MMGSRFAGTILPGAMPWLHQYIGNPVLTWVLNSNVRTAASPTVIPATAPSPARPTRKCGCGPLAWSSPPKW